MKRSHLSVAVAAVSLGTAQVAVAGTDIFFNPLTQSAAVASPNHVNELNSPWQAPAGVAYENLTSMAEIEASIDGQSIVRSEYQGNNPQHASMWDMVAFDDEGENIFIPHEVFSGAGVTRYNIEDDFAEVLFSGDGNGSAQGDWSEDWGAFDPATYTPNETLLLGEEWSGEGRIIEVLNPHDDVEDIEIRELHSIANVSHEGLRFSKNGKTLYFVDENYSGSIYKFVMKNKGDYTEGQTFVLSVDAYDGVPSEEFYLPSNINSIRTGLATWVPLTNKNGSKIKTDTNPFEPGGGRIAADEAGGTPYGRPEDIEVGVLANGNEAVYFAATGENAVYTIEVLNKKKAIVKKLVQGGETPQNLGFAPTTGVLNSPDNLAQDALGNIYIIEDAPNSGNIGGDIWFVRDVNTDGEAESFDHFMSVQVNGAEATGMIFNPAKPAEFVVAVQHPSSTNLAEVPEGMGDALWKFDLSDVVPPTCEKGRKTTKRKSGVRTCSSDSDFNFVRDLKKAGN